MGVALRAGLSPLAFLPFGTKRAQTMAQSLTQTLRSNLYTSVKLLLSKLSTIPSSNVLVTFLSKLRYFLNFGIMKFLFKISASFILCLSSFISFSQEVEKIKIKKEDTYFKAEFDETNYKVIALDKYGNPYQEVVKSFDITFQDTEGHFETSIVGNVIPEKTVKYLKNRKRATSLCFKKIVAQDEEGHIQSLPDKCGVLIYPDCKNCDPNKKTKR